MGIIFGKKKVASRVTEQDKAILQLKNQRDKLKLYQRRIEGNLEKDRLLARKLLQDGKKDRAKLLLRKKKYQEQLLIKADGQLENIERLAHDLEFATIEIQVINGLKQGNESLKRVNELLNLEDIEKILDETREGVEKQQEIDAMLTGVLTSEDEDDVEAELQQIIDDSLPSVPQQNNSLEDLSEVSSDKEITKKSKKNREKMEEEPMMMET